MLRLATDENFQGDIIRGLLRRQPDLDLVRIQDVGLAGASDPAVLAWPAEEGRILLTHDVSTMPRFVFDRVVEGLAMPGVFEVGTHIPIADAIDEILFLAECSIEGEWEGQIRYLPF